MRDGELLRTAEDVRADHNLYFFIGLSYGLKIDAVVRNIKITRDPVEGGVARQEAAPTSSGGYNPASSNT